VLIVEQFDGDITHFDNRYAGDAGVHARFYIMPIKDEEASAEAGRPIYNDKEFIEIVAAGNANNIIKRKASSEDKQRFHKQYTLFKAGNEDQEIGTHLSEVPWLTRSQVEELCYMKIRTLEALANLDDSACAKVAGLYDLKKRAANHVQKASEAAPVEALHRENTELKNQIAALAQTVEEQTKLLQELKASKK
jgi:hypothetical protein